MHNQGASYPETVTKAKLRKGNTLLSYYASNYVHSSDDSWRLKIEDGQIRVDGTVVRDCSLLLKANQRLEYFRPPWVEPEIPTREIPILYEDDHVMVVNKPGKVPVLAGGFFFSNTVIALLQEEYTGHEILAPVHRLGRGTTGALLVAKTHKSGQILSKAFREHEISKFYLAILSGIVEEDEFTIEQPIGKTSKSGNMKFSDYNWVAMDSGKPSHSEFRVIFRNLEKKITLCRVKIRTGRPHQIRIHSAYAGHPLYGDPLYVAGGGVKPFEGSNNEGSEKPAGPLPGDTGYFLHSWKITFPHPESLEPVEIICEVPHNFRELLDFDGDLV